MDDDLVERLGKAALKVADRISPIGTADSYESWRRDIYEAAGRACLAEIAAAGMVVVPKEPTEEMIDSGGGELAGLWDSDDSPFSAASNVYAAMLSAIRKG